MRRTTCSREIRRFLAKLQEDYVYSNVDPSFKHQKIKRKGNKKMEPIDLSGKTHFTRKIKDNMAPGEVTMNLLRDREYASRPWYPEEPDRNRLNSVGPVEPEPIPTGIYTIVDTPMGPMGMDEETLERYIANKEEFDREMRQEMLPKTPEEARQFGQEAANNQDLIKFMTQPENLKMLKERMTELRERLIRDGIDTKSLMK